MAYLLTRLLVIGWIWGVVILVIRAISKSVVSKAPGNIFKTLAAILIWPILALTKNGRRILLNDINKQ